jgi:hypothetical protein
MKIPGLLAGFIPLIIFGVLAGQSVSSVEVALVVSLIAEVLFAYHDLRNRFILAWATIFIFGLSLLAIAGLNLTFIIPYMGTFIYTALAAVSFVSIISRTPFTVQYARTMVDKALWDHPLFLKVNVFMTGVWGTIFLINLILSVAIVYLPVYTIFLQPLTWIVLISGVVFTVMYPRRIRKQESGRRSNTG